MKKFLSSSLTGVPAGLGLADAAGLVAVVVAGDMAGEVPGTIGDMPGEVTAAGVVPGMAGLVATAGLVAGMAGLVAGTAGEVTGAVVGAVAAGLVVVGGAAGDVWPNEVSARVTVQRLAISSVFIGLI